MRIEIKENAVEFYSNKNAHSFTLEFENEFDLNLINRFALFYNKHPRRHKARKLGIEHGCYWFVVWEITEKNAHKVQDIHTRGAQFHLDHIIPIQYGFENNINPHIIGSHLNLQMLPAKENLKKSNNITEKAIELLKKFEL